MKLFLVVIGIFAFGNVLFYYPEYASSYAFMLRLDNNSKRTLPRNFRITSFKTSGSGQFSEGNLRFLLKSIPHKNVIIVDLREEPHAFLNGNAMSWFRKKNWLNRGKPLIEIEREDRDKILKLSKRFFAILYRKKEYTPHLYLVKDLVTEEEMVRRYSANYLRLPVTDHTHPSDAIVDKFITFIKGLERETWLHFHCSAGRGRTTTFLAMHQMMKTFKQSSLEEIITYAETVGGLNLFELPEKENWKYPHVLERKEFVQLFYHYCVENPTFELLFSQWKKNKRLT